MNRVAYLLLRISKRSGRVRHAQITSEWPATECGDDEGTWALLCQSYGSDFQKAHDAMILKVRGEHPWLLPLLHLAPLVPRTIRAQSR